MPEQILRCVGIDPGPQNSGFVHAMIGDNVLEVLEAEKAIENGKLAWRVEELAGQIEGDGVLAVESPAAIYSSVGKSTIDTIRFVGYLERCALDEAVLISPAEVRVHVANTAKAKDGGVRQALIDRFGEPGTKKAPGPTRGIASHAWRALAVAVVARDRFVADAKKREDYENHDLSPVVVPPSGKIYTVQFKCLQCHKMNWLQSKNPIDTDALTCEFCGYRMKRVVGSDNELRRIP